MLVSYRPIKLLLTVSSTPLDNLLHQRVLCVDHKSSFPSVAWSFLITVLGCRMSSLAFSKLSESRSARGHTDTTNQPSVIRIPRATFRPVHWRSQSLSDGVDFYDTQQKKTAHHPINKQYPQNAAWHLHKVCQKVYKKLRYRKQITRQLHTQYVKGICSNSMTLKSRLWIAQGHWKWHHSRNRIEVPISVPQ